MPPSATHLPLPLRASAALDLLLTARPMRLLPPLLCLLLCASCLAPGAARPPAAGAARRPAVPALAPSLFPEGFSGAWIGMSRIQFLAGHPGIEPFLGEDFFLEDCASPLYGVAGYAFADGRLRTIQLSDDVAAEGREARLREAVARLGAPTRTVECPMRTLTRRPVPGATLVCTVWERPEVWAALMWRKDAAHGADARVVYALFDPAEAAEMGLASVPAPAEPEAPQSLR